MTGGKEGKEDASKIENQEGDTSQIERKEGTKTIVKESKAIVKVAPNPASGQELTFYGEGYHWRSPREKDDVLKEIEKLGDEALVHWNPVKEDFQVIADHQKIHPFGILSFGAILGKIAMEKEKVSRINVITHGNPAEIHFTGTVDRAGVNFLLSDPNSFDLPSVENLDDPVGFKIGKRQFHLKDVTGHFAKGAVFVLFSCHSGTDPEFLQTLSNKLKITVKGFKKLVEFRITVVDGKIDSYQIGAAHDQLKLQFHDINLDDRDHVLTKTPS